MQSATKAIVAAAAAAALQGCAGSGGGDNGVIGETFPELLLCAPLGICGAPKSLIKSEPYAPAVPAPFDPTRYAFARWSDHLGQQTGVRAVGPETVIQYEVSADASVHPTTEPTFDADAPAWLRYDEAGKLNSLLTNQVGLVSHFGTLAGHTGIEAARNLDVGYQGAGFADAKGDIGLVANPYELGWNYQSFGVWNGYGIAGQKAWRFGANSYGVASPANAVPSVGSATFTGKLGGLYVPPTGQGSIAAADLRVTANFSARSLSFASTGTTITRDPTKVTAAANLNLNGTLTYSPGANAFNGTLTNAGGTMSGASNGQFYGPAAQELGGVFTLKSPTTVETFAGAYGAKR